MARVRAEWGSVGEFVRRERLGWGDEGEEVGGKGAFEDVGMFSSSFVLIFFPPSSSSFLWVSGIGG